METHCSAEQEWVAELASAYARFMATDCPKAGAELIKGINERVEANQRFEKIATSVTGHKLTAAMRAVEGAGAAHMECHFTAHKAYVAKCGEWTTGALKHSADLAALCAATEGDSRSIVAAINEACAK